MIVTVIRSVFTVELSTNSEIYNGENFIDKNHFDIIHSGTAEESFYPSEKIEDIQLPEIEDSVLSNYNILIIDDNSDIRNYLADELSKYFMVNTAVVMVSPVCKKLSRPIRI